MNTASIIGVAIVATISIAILTFALMIRDAARNGYQITGGVSFKLAKQYPPKDQRAIITAQPAAKPTLRDAGAA